MVIPPHTPESSMEFFFFCDRSGLLRIPGSFAVLAFRNLRAYIQALILTNSLYELLFVLA